VLAFLHAGDSNSKSQYAGGILLPPVQKLVASFIFPQGKCKRISGGSVICQTKYNTLLGVGFFARRRFEFKMQRG